MKIISWNISGIRPKLARDNFIDFIYNTDASILCFQETKTDEDKTKIPELMCEKYPFRYWNSSDGTSQRKGFSGTAIWSAIKPIQRLETPDFDKEGRLVTLEFEEFILLCVYTPNSQDINSERFTFRIEYWDTNFREYINKLNQTKSTIVCGDFNVANLDIDLYNAKKYKNKVAGFYDLERLAFTKYIEDGFIDNFRYLHGNELNKYTYWNQRVKTCREKNLGWRIDYFISSKDIIKRIDDCNIMAEQLGSDHCPIYLIFN